MQKTLIAAFDYETHDLETVAQITPDTPLEISEVKRISNITGNVYTLGWNLYADGVLLETYDTTGEAEWVRDSITINMDAGAEIIIV